MTTFETHTATTGLPQEGFVREWQILGCRRRGIAPVIPVSHAGWWAGIADGRYPRPVKLSTRVTAWPVSAIRDLIERVGAEQ
jgi:predicted DNA-binding transcriptional regulator AlpA